MSAKIDLKRITEAYRILGLSMDASLQECRSSRNELIQRFHPDKHPEGWLHDSVSLEQRMHLVQEAYCYIVEHFTQISVALKPLNEQKLSNQMPKSLKSHWAYKQVQGFKKE